MCTHRKDESVFHYHSCEKFQPIVPLKLPNKTWVETLFSKSGRFVKPVGLKLTHVDKRPSPT